MIRAIPTEYNGKLFRSRLEARWAVFFYHLGIQYKHEQEWDEVKALGFRIHYKPDFYLPALDYWVEVKPKSIRELNDLEIMKATGWADEWENLVILSGPPRLLKETSEAHYIFWWNQRKKEVSMKGYMWWCECPKCRRIDLVQFGGIPQDCRKTCFPEDAVDLFGNELPEPNGHKSSRILEAYKVARTYKF